MAANPRCVSTAWAKIEITHGKSPRKSSRTSSGPAFIELEGNARRLAPRHSGCDATRLQAGTSARRQTRIPSAFASRRTRQPRPMLNRMAANLHPDWPPHFFRF
ncbi:hypothetical protein [Burkholderia anthina]|uniref:hypothetical protein n=1 Tax=Burkholderia anthina TaxID=179879 RepID=UPI001FC8A29C|nr:hypothetical protein [Burkholderia anthina]